MTVVAAALHPPLAPEVPNPPSAAGSSWGDSPVDELERSTIDEPCTIPEDEAEPAPVPVAEWVVDPPSGVDPDADAPPSLLPVPAAGMPVQHWMFAAPGQYPAVGM